jgi:hypothetical protein
LGSHLQIAFPLTCYSAENLVVLQGVVSLFKRQPQITSVTKFLAGLPASILGLKIRDKRNPFLGRL